MLGQVRSGCSLCVNVFIIRICAHTHMSRGISV